MSKWEPPKEPKLPEPKGDASAFCIPPQIINPESQKNCKHEWQPYPWANVYCTRCWIRKDVWMASQKEGADQLTEDVS